MNIKRLHHVAIICSDYEQSKYFYTTILGFEILNELYRKDRDSHKLDLALNGQYLIELFSFPNPPQRQTQPESTGLRHISFEVNELEQAIAYLKTKSIVTEPIRIDELTNKKFTFFKDPDNLPIEIYEY